MQNQKADDALQTQNPAFAPGNNLSHQKGGDVPPTVTKFSFLVLFLKLLYRLFIIHDTESGKKGLLRMSFKKSYWMTLPGYSGVLNALPTVVLVVGKKKKTMLAN